MIWDKTQPDLSKLFHLDSILEFSGGVHFNDFQKHSNECHNIKSRTDRRPQILIRNTNFSQHLFNSTRKSIQLVNAKYRKNNLT